MVHIEVERSFPHPVERVFRRYTDHQGWTEWAGLGRVRLTRVGSPDRDGVGCVRAFSVAPGLREEVVGFEPPSRMEYRVTRGPIPFDQHHGEVRFLSEGSSTRVIWRVSLRPRLPGVGWVVERGFPILFRRVLASLARDLDVRRG